MSSNTCVIVSAMFMYGGVTVIVSREILTNNLCKRLLKRGYSPFCASVLLITKVGHQI